MYTLDIHCHASDTLKVATNVHLVNYLLHLSLAKILAPNTTVRWRMYDHDVELSAQRECRTA